MITINSVNKNYITKNNVVPALVDVSLKLPRKGFILICGESGSGKTTLLKLISGIEKIDEGEILIDNTSINELSNEHVFSYIDKNVGFVFQDYNLFEKNSVYENLNLVINDEKNPKQKIKETLKKVDLLGFEKRKVSTLSSGERQRLAIARAILKNSKIILADEPTGSLDDENSIKILNIFKQISKEKLVIISSHDIKNSRKYADLVFILREGKIYKKTFNDFLDYTQNIGIELNQKFSYKKTFKTLLLFLKNISFRNILFSILSILFSLFVFTIFGFLFNGKNKVLNKEYNNSNYNEIFLSKKTIGNKNKNLKIDYNKILLDENDLDNIKKITKNESIYPIYESSVFTDYLFPLINYNSIPEYDKNNYDVKINGLIKYEEKLFKDFNIKLLEGYFPKYNEQYTEVLITEVIFNVLKKYGKNKYEKYSDIIGEVFSADVFLVNTNFKIIGVIDTNFNYIRYKDFFEKHKKTEIDIEGKEYLKKGFHSSLFLSKSFFEKIESNTFYNNVKISFPGYRTSFLNTLKEEKNNVFYKEGYIFNGKLKNKEIIIPIYKGTYEIEFENKLHEELFSFVHGNFSEVSEKFKLKFGADKNENDYLEYIKREKINEFHRGKNLDYFKKIAHYKIAIENKQTNLISFYSELYDSNILNIQDVEIVGSYLVDNQEEAKVYVSDNLINEVNKKLKYYNNPYSSFIVPNKSNGRKKLLDLNEKIITNVELIPDILLSENINLIYYTRTYLHDNLDTWYSGINEFKILIYSIFVIIVILFILFLFYFANSIFKNRKKEYGIVMSLGMSKRKLIGILAIENLILFSSIFIFSMLFSFIFSKYIAKEIVDIYYLKVNPFLFDYGITFILLIIIILQYIFMILYNFFKIKNKNIMDLVNE